MKTYIYKNRRDLCQYIIFHDWLKVARIRVIWTGIICISIGFWRVICLHSVPDRFGVKTRLGIHKRDGCGDFISIARIFSSVSSARFPDKTQNKGMVKYDRKKKRIENEARPGGLFGGVVGRKITSENDKFAVIKAAFSVFSIHYGGRKLNAFIQHFTRFAKLRHHLK